MNVDHRRMTMLAPGDLTADARAAWDVAPNITYYIEAVHRLSDLGALVTHVAVGTSQDGFEAEWRGIDLSMVDGDLINRYESFDATDLDTALARFDELSRPAPRLANAASQQDEGFWTFFEAREWTAVAEIVADDILIDDRRRVVNAGIQHGLDAHIADVQAVAEVGGQHLARDIIATRGDRLCLTHIRASSRLEPGEVAADVLCVVEVNANNRITARIGFDVDQIDPAFEELDARYVAGEAAAHAQTWRVITRAVAAFNRREMPATTTDYIIVDHQLHNDANSVTEYVHAAWDLTPDSRAYVEAVHRLSDLGGVVTLVSNGTSQEGFDAEWRIVEVITREGDAGKSCEMFNETDLATALARFDELSRPAQRLENAASRVTERVQASLALRDWDAIAEILAYDISDDDRRRVVNAGIRRGRETEIDNMRAVADLGATLTTSDVIATRGERLTLIRMRLSIGDEEPRAFDTQSLNVVEIDTDDRIAGIVTFDHENLNAAIEELDARYRAGEAAAHAPTWTVIAQAYAALNRHELPAIKPDWANIDHRRATAFAPGDGIAYIRATFDLADLATYMETVHRLTDLGAVVTSVGTGTSREGFSAEWRLVGIVTVDGDLISRCEVFEEADLDAALARFDELHTQSRRLNNAASRVDDHFAASFAARDWDAMAELTAETISIDDRRHVVNAGLRRGRDVEIANLRARAAVGMEQITSTVVAARGRRLALTRTRFSGRDQGPDAFHVEALCIIEINADEKVVARVGFDLDDFDAAIAELDARYLAGEATAHAETWRVITTALAALNRREMPTMTTDYTIVDHQLRNEANSVTEYVHAAWDLTPDLRAHIEAVHRLSDLGGVVTLVSNGTSQEGFDAEWRIVLVITREGDAGKSCEIFDEKNLGTALARFEELHTRTPPLENRASRVSDRLLACFGARDWDAIVEILSEDATNDDRRPMVGSGVRRGRDAEIANMHAIAAIGIERWTSEPIATRGERLVLGRHRFSRGDQQPHAFVVEVLGVTEIDDDDRIAAVVAFGPDDIDAAFEELDARYLAGEAAAHAHTWSVIAGVYAVFNRHELPATTSDWANIDHRSLLTVEPDDMAAFIPAVWDLTPDLRIYMEAVHRLTELGAVVTHTARGVSKEGLDAEWRMLFIYTIENDLISRFEMFDEADLAVALARFEELQSTAPRLENAASQTIERFQKCFGARNWDAFAELLAEDVLAADHRPVLSAGVRDGRNINIGDWRAVAEVGFTDITSTVVATRGERLVLSRFLISTNDRETDAFHNEVLGIGEINTDNRLTACIMFDVDDIDAAFEELDARYLAGEAAAYAHTWSVIVGSFAAVNRGELPELTPDWVNIDHRRALAVAPGEMTAYIKATFDDAPGFRVYIEAVHRLTDLGVVVTQASHGISQEGFEAEWRMVNLSTVEGDLISRGEIFDDTDLDAALTRFEELHG